MVCGGPHHGRDGMVAGALALVMRKQKEMDTVLYLFLLLIQYRIVLPTFRVGLPSAKAQVQRYFSLVTLNPIKLTTKINPHIK